MYPDAIKSLPAVPGPNYAYILDIITAFVIEHFAAEKAGKPQFNPMVRRLPGTCFLTMGWWRTFGFSQSTRPRKKQVFPRFLDKIVY